MTAVSTQTGPGGTPIVGKKTGVDALNGNFDMFLRMLTTQLQNQDPLKPMDTAEFTQQLVSYSQVEQSIKTNEKLAGLEGLLGGQALSQATGLIGRDVAINMPTSVLGEDGARWTYNLGTNASLTKVSVVDSKGNVVRTLEGQTKSGMHDVTWDGKNDQGVEMPAGLYTLKVEASTAAGTQVSSWVAGRGVVQSVHFENGEPLLDLGGASVRIADLLTVRAGTKPA